MIDKGKYASHGTFIKKIHQQCLGRGQKLKLAVINPLPSSCPRNRSQNVSNEDMKLNSKKFDAKFKFQQQIKIKPVSNELVKPFLYIEKVIKPQTVDQKLSANPIKYPFITSKVSKSTRKNLNARNISSIKAPDGYHSLFEYELDKKNIADKVYQKLVEAEVENVKDLFNLWNKDPKRKLGNDINIRQDQFIEFVKELLPNRISTNHIKHFFELYKNKVPNKQSKQGEKNMVPDTISIRAFSFNFMKYKKAETEITNIMSEKAVKDRYKQLKLYIQNFLKQYPDLKEAMKGIKQYEEILRNHFQRTYESYENPFQGQINQMKEELKKPIIKYDKVKKQQLEENINKYQEENHRLYHKLTDEYNSFMDAYEGAIVKNHDLFFTKRTVAHLLKPIIDHYPHITRELVEEQVYHRREEKQRYLQTLSEIVVEIDNDKKIIVEDTFTLADIVMIIEGRKRKGQLRGEEQIEFVVNSMKKLIKEIKRQFLVKNKLTIENIDNFPADQQIPLEIMHVCFEMQCTKILFKNKIWDQLLLMLPQRSLSSRLHQHKIDCNTCMEYLLKYFKKLDERANTQLNKSKQISLLAENAYQDNFGHYAEIINKVCTRLDCYVEGLDEEDEQKKVEDKKKKKVGFADIVDTKLAVDRGQENALQRDRAQIQIQNTSKAILKMIHHPEAQQRSMFHQNDEIQQIGQSRLMSPAQNLSMVKTLARSYFEAEAMNTNAFDIRFYEKMNEEEKQKLDPAQRQLLIQLGNSMLLEHAPKVDQIQGQKDDPLKISRYLLKTIDGEVKESQKQVKGKQYDHDIKEGVTHSYYRDKIKLENKPTRFDSEGRSKYSVLLPVGYYESYVVGQNVPDQEKWYLRPHHIETLTENPLSKKDNIINTEYQSKLQKLGLKKRPDQFIIQANVKRKQELINALEERINSLKGEVGKARRSSQIPGTKVPNQVLDQYYEKISQGKEDKQLQLAGYQAVLYDLRRKQRQLLNDYRGKQTYERGEPDKKWWQRKDKFFNHELKKDRQLLVDSLLKDGKHRAYVEKLKNSEIY